MSNPTPSTTVPTPAVSPATGVESPTGGGFFSKTGDAISSGFGKATELGGKAIKSVLGSNKERYNPKKIYSFIIVRTTGGRSASKRFEFPLLLGPNGYSESYNMRTSVKPTLGGSAIIDFGPGNNTIKLQGEWYIPFLTKVPDPSKKTDDSVLGLLKENIEGAKVIDNLKDNLGIRSWTEYRSGIEEFFLLQYMLYHSHGYGKRWSSLFDVSKIDSVLDLERFNYRDHALYFRDYDRNRYVEVALTDEMMTVSRSTKDTNTLTWSINLTVIGEKSEKDNLLFNAGGDFNFSNLGFALTQLFSDLRSLVELPLRLQGALLSIARRVGDFIKNTKEFIDYATVGLFKNINDQGKLFNTTWDDIRDSVSGKKKGSISEQLNSVVQNVDNNFAKFSSQLINLTTEVEAILAIAGVLTVGTSSGNSIEEELTAPGGSFFDLINTDLYATLVNVLWIFEEIQANVIKASVDTSYQIFQLDASDNLYIVADKLYGDSGLAVALATYNKIRVTELPKGSVIRTAFGSETGIIKPLPASPDPIDLEESLIGGDIRLEDNRDFAVAVNGDLGLVIGDEALVNNILDLVDVPEGSIPFFPNLGNPLNIGEIYTNEEIQIAANELLAQIQADNRVQEVTLKEIYQDGDTIAFVYDLVSRTGKSFAIQF